MSFNTELVSNLWLPKIFWQACQKYVLFKVHMCNLHVVYIMYLQIKRPYFHVKPLEKSQLKNWKEYLDFEIEAGDHERVVILFERCMIATALYEDFWLKVFLQSTVILLPVAFLCLSSYLLNNCTLEIISQDSCFSLSEFISVK